jgi:integrase/recombinase XerD
LAWPQTPTPRPLNLTDLLESWKTVLRAQHKAESTYKSYTAGVWRFIAWCEQRGETPALDRRLVNTWIAELLADGLEGTTVKARQLAVRRFSAWLDEEDDIPYTDQLLGIKPPKLAEKLIEPLTDRELRLMILACEGKALRDRRDEAIVRLMAETGLRAGEVMALQVDDVNLATGTASIRTAKSGRGRIVPFSPEAAMAIDRYLRLRRRHSRAASPNLWLGERGHSLSYMGLRASLTERAELAGIKNFHLHLLRHTAASRWLRRGGSEQGLMSVAGWSNRSMLDRYTRASASERAAAEARSLGLGDL